MRVRPGCSRRARERRSRRSHGAALLSLALTSHPSSLSFVSIPAASAAANRDARVLNGSAARRREVVRFPDAMPDLPEDHRLQVLQSTRLLDSAPEPAFDRLTRLAASLLRAPGALISLVDEQRQFFKSALGLKEPWASRRETPLSHSFCQHATRERARLIVNDAREHPILRDSLAVRDLDVIAYAGIPLFVANEAIIGASPASSTTRPGCGARTEAQSPGRPRRSPSCPRSSFVSPSGVAQELAEGPPRRSARRGKSSATRGARHRPGSGPSSSRTRRRAGCSRTASSLASHSPKTGARSIAPGASTARRCCLRREGALGRALRGEDTDNLTFTLQRPGASEPIWVEASGRPVRGATGNVIAAVSVYRDVTERKRRADLYAVLASNIPSGVVGLFDENLRCVALDGGMLRSNGISPQSMVGRPMRDLAGEDANGQFDLIEDAYRRTLGGESLSADFRHGDRVLELHTSPVRDTLGRVVAGLVLALDKTKDRGIEAALRRSEQVYRAIVNNLPNASILLIDRDLRYVAADGPLIAERAGCVHGEGGVQISWPHGDGGGLRCARTEIALGRALPRVASRAASAGTRRSSARDGSSSSTSAPIYDIRRPDHARARRALRQYLEQKREAAESPAGAHRAARRDAREHRSHGDWRCSTPSGGSSSPTRPSAGCSDLLTSVSRSSTMSNAESTSAGGSRTLPCSGGASSWRSTGRFSGDFVFVQIPREIVAVLRRSWAQIALPWTAKAFS